FLELVPKYVSIGTLKCLNGLTTLAYMEQLLEDGINALHIGPQGMGGDKSVMGVNIEHGSRHPSVISVAVNVGCWNHRRGHMVFDKDGKYEILSHKGVTF
ncbi:MAG: fumarate hydratase, partial [Veillonella parvula]